MLNFSEYSDEELIDISRKGDSKVTEYLIDKYKKMVLKNAGDMFILGADRDDLIQEGMIGLFKAVRDFDKKKDANFSTFASLCISRQMYTAVNNSNRKKHAPLNAYISFFASASAKDDNGDYSGDETLMNTLMAGEDSNPETLIIDKEQTEKIYRLIEENLSGFEQSVLELYIAGISTAAIARILEKDAKSTDNALQRVRAKLKKELKAERKD